MKIEELLELSTVDLEALANNPQELEKHFGWCLTVTRPSEEAKAKLLAGASSSKRVKATSPKKLQKQAQSNQLDAARLFAIEQAKKMGIDLKI